MKGGYLDHKEWFAAVLLAILFVAVQVSTLDYGAKINDLPHILDHEVNSETLRAGSSLARQNVVGGNSLAERETISRWMLRYKLYSIEADEMVNIMALSKIKPSERKFDPGFYQYGGAWLYPLGLWYYGLTKVGLVSNPSLSGLLEEPDQMDAVYFWGRFFVLVAVSLSAIPLYLTIRLFLPHSSAILAVAIYLALPASIMYSQVMKPHWYSLIWVNSALYLLVRGLKRGGFRWIGLVGIGVFLGLAVGSSLPNGLFACFVWLVLLAGAIRGRGSYLALIFVPAVAITIWLLTNPYLILNWSAVVKEGGTTAGWYGFEVNWRHVAAFVWNSLFVGFGAIFVSAALLSCGHFVLSRGPLRWFAVAIFATILLVSALTSNQSHWHTNYRYATYLAPALILVISLAPIPRRNWVLAAILSLTALQSVPLKIAYWDENNSSRSTRLLSAQWIVKNIPEGSKVCVGTDTPAPYDVPPISFARYQINTDDCNWLVKVEREYPARSSPQGWTRKKVFKPRFFYPEFPMVFEHINPQISIFTKRG